MHIDDAIRSLQVSDAILRQLALCGDTCVMQTREEVLRAIAKLEAAKTAKWAGRWDVTTGDPIAPY